MVLLKEPTTTETEPVLAIEQLLYSISPEAGAKPNWDSFTAYMNSRQESLSSTLLEHQETLINPFSYFSGIKRDLEERGEAYTSEKLQQLRQDLKSAYAQSKAQVSGEERKELLREYRSTLGKLEVVESKIHQVESRYLEEVIDNQDYDLSQRLSLTKTWLARQEKELNDRAGAQEFYLGDKRKLLGRVETVVTQVLDDLAEKSYTLNATEQKHYQKLMNYIQLKYTVNDELVKIKERTKAGLAQRETELALEQTVILEKVPEIIPAMASVEEQARIGQPVLELVKADPKVEPIRTETPAVLEAVKAEESNIVYGQPASEPSVSAQAKVIPFAIKTKKKPLFGRARSKWKKVAVGVLAVLGLGGSINGEKLFESEKVQQALEERLEACYPACAPESLLYTEYAPASEAKEELVYCTGKPSRMEEEYDVSKAQEEVTYTVRKGDTLWELSKKHLHNPHRWTEIAEDNGVKDPRKLSIGKLLVIPSELDATDLAQR